MFCVIFHIKLDFIRLLKVLFNNTHEKCFISKNKCIFNHIFICAKLRTKNPLQ